MWVSFFFHILKASIQIPDNTHYLVIPAFSPSLRKVLGKGSKVDRIDLYLIILLRDFYATDLNFYPNLNFHRFTFIYLPLIPEHRICPEGIFCCLLQILQ